MNSNCVRKSVTVDNGNGDGNNSSRFQVAKVPLSDVKSDEDNDDHDLSQDTINSIQRKGHQMSVDYTATYYDTKNVKSLRHYTREALPRVDNYRNIMSVHAHMTRPTLDELHGVQTTISPDPKVSDPTITFNFEI